jgi:hypothetical protein
MMNTENDSEMKNDVVEKTLRRMAKVYDFFGMWHGSQNLRATQKTLRV